MFDTLFTYKELVEYSPEDQAFAGVVFLKDFGPYKEGDKVHILWFILTKGIVEEYDESGSTVVKSFPFHLSA